MKKEMQRTSSNVPDIDEDTDRHLNKMMDKVRKDHAKKIEERKKRKSGVSVPQGTDKQTPEQSEKAS